VMLNKRSTIIGQGIGMALRGLRPIAEIHTLIIYCTLSKLWDDLATLQYRTVGKQKPH
jgi:pyruvate/2-oxoglutarate/acetoin dehydrogenase E1 component